MIDYGDKTHEMALLATANSIKNNHMEPDDLFGLALRLIKEAKTYGTSSEERLILRLAVLGASTFLRHVEGELREWRQNQEDML